MTIALYDYDWPLIVEPVSSNINGSPDHELMFRKLPNGMSQLVYIHLYEILTKLVPLEIRC